MCLAIIHSLSVIHPFTQELRLASSSVPGRGASPPSPSCDFKHLPGSDSHRTDMWLR